MNVARAVGPASPACWWRSVGVGRGVRAERVTFLVFARRAGDVAAGGRRRRARPPEPFVAALRAGGRYVRHSPAMRRYPAAGGAVHPARRARCGRCCRWSRATGWTWAPAATGCCWPRWAWARSPARLSCPDPRERLSDNQLLLPRAWCTRPSLAVVALVAQRRSSWSLALVPAGYGLDGGAVATSTRSVQLFLPGWVRARGLAAYQMVVLRRPGDRRVACGA